MFSLIAEVKKQRHTGPSLVKKGFSLKDISHLANLGILSWQQGEYFSFQGGYWKANDLEVIAEGKNCKVLYCNGNYFIDEEFTPVPKELAMKLFKHKEKKVEGK